MSISAPDSIFDTGATLESYLSIPPVKESPWLFSSLLAILHPEGPACPPKKLLRVQQVANPPHDLAAHRSDFCLLENHPTYAPLCLFPPPPSLSLDSFAIYLLVCVDNRSLQVAVMHRYLRYCAYHYLYLRRSGGSSTAAPRRGVHRKRPSLLPSLRPLLDVMSWRSADRPKDYYQERRRNGAGREDFEEPCYCGPPSSHGQRFGGQTSRRGHGPPNSYNYDRGRQYDASRGGRHGVYPADVHQRYGYSGRGGYHRQQYENAPPHDPYERNVRGHARHYRGRPPRGVVHPGVCTTSRGGWSRCSDALVHHRKGNAPLTAGESLLNFKRTVNRMNSDYDRSVLSESCAYSVSETGDARSQYNEDNYAAHWHGDGAGGTTSSPSRDDSIDCKEAVRRGGPLPRDVGFRRRGRPFVARGVSSLTSLISVLWDIENCAVPNGVPAYQIVLKVRQTFYVGYREGDFVVACDTARMSPTVVAELNEAQVTVIHVPGGQKNAADDKLRTVLRRFSDAHKLTNSRIVLISGDGDFAAEIHEMRYTNLIEVVLIHNEQAKRALRDAATESISYREFLADLSNRKRSAPKVVRTLQFDTRNEAKNKGTKQDLKKSVPAVVDYDKERQMRDELTNTEMRAEEQSALSPSYRTKVGLLVAREPMNAEFWKRYLSRLNIPKDFTLEAAYEDQAAIYEAQLAQFLKTISDLPQSPQKADNATTTEIARLKRASVVYGVKSKILKTLSERQVLFVTSSPGSRTALEVASYAQDLDLRVISVQFSDLSAEQCSKNAVSMSGLGPVQCWLNPKQPIKSECTVVVTSARHFFQEFVRREVDFSDFKVIIVDELEKESAYQRVALAIIRKHFVSRVSVILCGNESDACTQIQEELFLKSQDVVRGALTFPVEIINKEKPANRVMACISTALEFCQTSEVFVGGDVLVFLPSLADAILADGILRHKIREEDIGVPITHEVLSTSSPASPQSPRKGCWRVIFTAECPDAVLSTLQVRCVVDSGLTLRTIYQNGTFVMQLACVTKVEAEKRRTLAGQHESGTCYRLYDKPAQSYSLQADLYDSKYLEDIVLRLSTQKTSSDTFILDELFSKSLLEQVKSALKQIEAFDSQEQMTDLGARLCQISLPPRVGMLVLRSIGKAPSIDAVLLSLLVFEDMLLAYRPLKEDGSQHDFPVSEGASVFSGVIQRYKDWLVVPKKMKRSWCDVNGVNEAFMTYLHNAVQRVQQEFTEFQGRNLGADCAKEEKTATITLSELLAQSFPEGVLEACEHGYKHPIFGDELQVSPLSLFDTEATKPQKVVCCLFAQAIEEKLRARSDGAKGYLELDTAGQCITIRGHEKYCSEAQECLQNIVK
ncbi:hypothetical protein HPB51_000236 [Rhipicephalus microplus]|uniref:NYN domain-containing protein n=1 Tax=Rhipicephalus microplus TaxID=6941 RepID=A0A9J6EVL7_RHIMP|nr:hypothetical protein HPB51_000236 [Rhipicephalus microplus]